MSRPLRLGLVVNPFAGIGGSVALKGSDSEEAHHLAQSQLAAGKRRAGERVVRALERLQPCKDRIELLCWGNEMGGFSASAAGFTAREIGSSDNEDTSAADTRSAARALAAQGIDLLLFAGGDGTARDVFDAVGSEFPVLGIPAGVKMHSGVFAVSPEAAGDLLVQLAQAGLVDLWPREVRDIDEEAFRQDRVKTRFYGEMLVPAEGRYLQQTKVAGRESVELVAAEIAAGIVEHMEPAVLYLIGPGSTTAAIMEELGLPNTLLGVDVVANRQLIASDVDEAALLDLLADPDQAVQMILTAIGGQGHVFGRGNQQFSPAVIRRVGNDNIQVIAAKSKITALEGRPLLVDTNDVELDEALSGYRSILTGYEDRILYPLARTP